MSALSGSFECLCNGFMAIINILLCSAGINFRRQNLTSMDVSFWGIKSVPRDESVNGHQDLTPHRGLIDCDVVKPNAYYHDYCIFHDICTNSMIACSIAYEYPLPLKC